MTTPPTALFTAPGRRRIWLRRAVIFVGVPYLGLCLLGAMFQRKLIYAPARTDALPASDVSLPGAVVESVVVPTDDGLQLNGWRFISMESPYRNPAAAASAAGRSTPLVLYFSGNGGNRAWRLREVQPLVDLGADVLLVDYRGYAENLGHPSEEGLAIDARAVWRFAVEDLGAVPAQVVLFGESLGGGVAVRLASELCRAGTPPGGLVLRSTYSCLADVAAFHFPWLPVRWFLVDRFPSIERVSSVTAPILALHGRQDTIVPCALGLRLFEACPSVSAAGIAKRMVELPAAGHNDVLETEGPAYRQALRDFFDQLVEKR